MTLGAGSRAWPVLADIGVTSMVALTEQFACAGSHIEDPLCNLDRFGTKPTARRDEAARAKILW